MTPRLNSKPRSAPEFVPTFKDRWLPSMIHGDADRDALLCELMRKADAGERASDKNVQEHREIKEDLQGVITRLDGTECDVADLKENAVEGGGKGGKGGATSSAMTPRQQLTLAKLDYKKAIITLYVTSGVLVLGVIYEIMKIFLH